MEWRQFDPAKYWKKFYDVRTPDGDVVGQCWPNAGRMMATDGSGRMWTACEIRLSAIHPGDGKPQSPEPPA